MWRFRAARVGRCALVWGRVGPPSGGHGVSAPAGGLSSGMHPPFSFPSCGKENGPCTVQKKRPLGRAPVQWPSARDGVGVSVPAPILPCLRARYSLLRGCSCRPVADGAEGIGVVDALPLILLSLPLAWRLTGAGNGRMRASAPTTARAARSGAERAEGGAGQMRPCTPLPSAPAPRESAVKSAPHPAAPVGRFSQTRRHHLSPTFVFKQTCTNVQVCAEHFFFSTGRGAFSF